MQRKYIPVTLLAAIGIVSTSGNLAANDKPTADKIYWSDGDSGKLNGVKFRLANVDAPETGSMKQNGGAKCEKERELGYDAKEFLVQLTKSANIQIEKEYGLDRYGRLVVDLSADGKDVGKLAVGAGHLKKWPHKKGKALDAKPNWCL